MADVITQHDHEAARFGPRPELWRNRAHILHNGVIDVSLNPSFGLRGGTFV
jgi:hypothetical protein